MEVCQGCDEESYADLGSLALRMPCHTLGMCVVPLYSYPWLFPARHYAVLELEEDHPLSSPQLEDEVGVPSADAVTGSHFLAREAPQNFPVIRYAIFTIKNGRQSKFIKYEAVTRVDTFLLHCKINTRYRHEYRHFICTVLTCSIHHHQAHNVKDT